MTVSIDTKTEKTTITCNTCKKSKIIVEGTRSKRQGYTKAIEAGWRWKNASTQICPSCRKIVDKAKEAKPVANKANGKATVRTAATSKKSQGKPGSVPSNIGQSIGKVAKSAKMSAAPAAE